jgi:hypothetical protein
VAVRQRIDRAEDQIFTQVRHEADALGVDAADPHADDLTRRPAHHPLGLEVGRGGHHAGNLLHLREHVRVVLEGSHATVHREVRTVPDDLLAPQALEAVHDREHGDDQPHARGHATDADHRDDRNEGLTPFGHQVAHGDEPLRPAAHLQEAGSRQRKQPEQHEGREERDQRAPG